MDVIAEGNWEELQHLCNSNVSWFRPETCGHLMLTSEFMVKKRCSKGIQDSMSLTKQNYIINPCCRLCDEDTAIIAYIRLIQDGEKTERREETLVW